MLKIYPIIDVRFQDYLPMPTTACISNEVVWQGIHICGIAITDDNEKIIFDLPVGEGSIRPAAYHSKRKQLYSYYQSDFNWYTKLFREITETPDLREIELNIIKKKSVAYKKIIILNTLDAWYGHSILFLFHLHRLFQKTPQDTGIIVIIQPFLEWMVPDEGVLEIWKAGINLAEAKKYYPSLNSKINAQMKRFETVYLSETPVLADSFDISMFTQTPIFSEAKFGRTGNRFTFIWREDVNRLWMSNYYFYAGLKLLKLQKILLPLQLIKVRHLLSRLRKAWGSNVVFTIAGMGSYGKFPHWVNDERATVFNDATERTHCRIYAESELVVGLHGSSMILPSAHAGMCISMMPPKRWGNFAEDIIFNDEKTFKCLFRKRVVPLNMPLAELIDICISMKKDVLSFNKKTEGAYKDIL